MKSDKNLKRATYMRLWRAENRERARAISRAGNAKYHSANRARINAEAREKKQIKDARLKADPIAHREFLNALARQRYEARVKADPNYLPKKSLHGKKWRAENPELARKVVRDAMQRWRKAHPDKVREQTARYHAKFKAQQKRKRDSMRAALLAFFGGKCLRCGFSDPRALHLDHIKGDGNKERKVGKGNKWDQYRLILSDPKTARARYQLLCANSEGSTENA